MRKSDLALTIMALVKPTSAPTFAREMDLAPWQEADKRESNRAHAALLALEAMSEEDFAAVVTRALALLGRTRNPIAVEVGEEEMIPRWRAQ